jgi:iron only hydrogenase large subunit-like protein
MSRIYLVSDDNFGRYLVRANTPQQAIATIAKQQYTVKVASQDELVALVSDGKKVVEARKDESIDLHGEVSE